MKFWRSKRELYLEPEKRALYIRVMASPVVLALAALVSAAIPPIAVLAFLFCFLSCLGSVIVIPWGLFTLFRINEEPYDFISSFRTLLFLNLGFLLCFVSFASVIAMELAND
jgi:hypothetical protein